MLNADIPVLIDNKHAIAHNKIMAIDGTAVITGSFNFTKAAEQNNAENLVILKGSPELVQRYTQNFEAHAAHSHAYQHEGGSPSPGRAEGEETSNGAVRGNPKSKICQVPDCPSYDRRTSASIVMFAPKGTAWLRKK